jgi:hypothetical protein
MAQARTYIPIGSTWRHRKGEDYFIVGHCVLAGYMVPAVLCRATDSIIWCRPASQFQDGRLTRIDTLTTSGEMESASALMKPVDPIPDSQSESD